METNYFDLPADREIHSFRVFDVPAEKLFEAWMNPLLLSKWWGPAGFTNTFHEFDPRPGGRWKFTMHGPEKGHYENVVEYLKIEHPRLIVWNRISQPHFRVVASFEKLGTHKTRLDFRMQFATKEACDKIRKFAPEKNEENFDRLEAVLQEKS